MKSNRRLLNRILGLFLIFFAHSNVWAASLTASVNKTKVVKDEVIQLRVISDKKLSRDEISFDVLSDDFYLGRPNFSSSVNIINGTRQDKSEWTIAIAPSRLGKITIPGFTVNGVSSAPITLNVTMSEQTFNADDVIESRYDISKQSLYPQQSVILDTRVIIKTDPRRLQDPNLTLPESRKGITLTPIGEPKQYQAVLEGQDVLIVDQSFQVTAQEPGRYTIEIPTLTGSMLLGDNRSGTTRLVPLSPTAKTISIEVKAQPSDYQGQWLPADKLSLTQVVVDSEGRPLTEQETISLQVGDSLTRTLTLTAQGLTTEQFPTLAIDNPSGFRVYSEKPTLDNHADGSSSMTLTQVIIAQKTGLFTLPKVSVQWWNSQKDTSQVSEVDALQVDVSASEVAHLPKAESLAQPTEKVVIVDAGLWPYVAAIASALWLMTLALLIRERRKPRTHIEDDSQPAATTANNIQSVLLAVKQNNPVRAQSAFDLYKRSTTLSADADKQIQQQLNQFHQSHFGKQPVAWQSDTLQNLLHELEKSHAKQVKASPLAKL